MPDVTQSATQNVVPPERIKAILDAIAKSMSMTGRALGGGAGAGAGPQSVPAQPGAIGAGAMPPPVPMGAPAGAGMPAALPPAAPQSRQQIQSQIPYEYSSPQARTGAVVSGAISSLSQFASNFAKQQFEKKRKLAEDTAYAILQSGGKALGGLEAGGIKSAQVKQIGDGLEAFKSADPERIAKIHPAIREGLQSAITKHTQLEQQTQERNLAMQKLSAENRRLEEQVRQERAKAVVEEAAAARAPEAVQAGIGLTKAQIGEAESRGTEALAHAKYLGAQAATPHEVDFSKLAGLGGAFKGLAGLGSLPTATADAIITNVYSGMNEVEKRKFETVENSKKNQLARDIAKMRFATGYTQATPEIQKDMVDNVIRGLTQPNGFRMWNILVGRDARLADASRQRLAELKITPEQFTQTTMQLAETSKEIVPLLWDLSASLDPKSKNYGRIKGKLGPWSGRFNEFLRKLGPADPDFAGLSTAMSMSASGTTRAHMGARGGFGMTTRFDKLFAAGHLTPEALKVQVDSVAWFLARAYADSVYHEGNWEPERYKGRGRPKAPMGMPNSWDVPAEGALPAETAPATDLSEFLR